MKQIFQSVIDVDAKVFVRISTSKSSSESVSATKRIEGEESCVVRGESKGRKRLRVKNGGRLP